STMVTLKLEICIEFVKLTVDLVAAMAESIEVAFRHRPPPQVPYSAGVNGRRGHYSTVPIPLCLCLDLRSDRSCDSYGRSRT
ncbi:hypothetical protein HID58_018382, partial [Brassica napus]